jgi:hypothetical protein
VVGARASDDSLIAVARSVIGTPSFAIAVRSRNHSEALFTSGRRERVAQNAEFVAGEGPAHDVRVSGAVWADADEIPRRWPLFGGVAAVLGVTSIAAVALHGGPTSWGTLTAFGSRDVPAPSPVDLWRAGLAITHALLRGAPPSPDALDIRPAFHQAVGIVAHRRGCSVGDAALLLRARAFGTGTDIDSLASQIVAGRLTIDAV